MTQRPKPSKKGDKVKTGVVLMSKMQLKKRF